MVADLGPLQVVVPTLSKMIEKLLFSVKVDIPHREYDSEGWLIWSGRIVAPLKNLKIERVAEPTLPFEPIKRIAPAVPLQFEVATMEPLPVDIARLAAFSCQFRDNLRPYLAIFRNMTPQFSRVYPFNGVDTLISVVADMQQQERDFVRKNREHLLTVPFYRERFRLSDRA